MYSSIHMHIHVYIYMYTYTYTYIKHIFTQDQVEQLRHQLDISQRESSMNYGPELNDQSLSRNKMFNGSLYNDHDDSDRENRIGSYVDEYHDNQDKNLSTIDINPDMRVMGYGLNPDIRVTGDVDKKDEILSDVLSVPIDSQEAVGDFYKDINKSGDVYNMNKSVDLGLSDCFLTGVSMGLGDIDIQSIHKHDNDSNNVNTNNSDNRTANHAQYDKNGCNNNTNNNVSNWAIEVIRDQHDGSNDRVDYDGLHAEIQRLTERGIYLCVDTYIHIYICINEYR
jgi:hypothetical protein